MESITTNYLYDIDEMIRDQDDLYDIEYSNEMIKYMEKQNFIKFEKIWNDYYSSFQYNQRKFENYMKIITKIRNGNFNFVENHF